MQQLFEHFQRFTQSSDCIFYYKPYDYPTIFQQHLITNYYELSNLLKSTTHAQIVRLLHSSLDRQLDLFLPGLLYQLLLDSNSAETIFQTYMSILRNQSWIAFDRLLQQFIKQAFLVLKPEFRSGITQILNKLYYFSHLSPELLIITIKSMDIFDLCQNSLNYNNSLLEVFHHILAQGSQHQQLRSLLSTKLFYKIIRLLTYLHLIQDETIKDYKNRCIQIIYRLFAIDKDGCLAMGWPIITFINQLERQDALSQLLENCRQHLIRKAPLPQSTENACIRLSMILPLRIELVLQFIIKQQLSPLEIGVQLNWAFLNAAEHFEFVTVDILRYILSLPSQDLPINQCLYLMEWLFYRSCTNNILFQIWKGVLFQPCFQQPCPNPYAPERAFRFLMFLIQNNIQFGQTLLLYLLRQLTHPQFGKRLTQLLIQANNMKLIDIASLLSNQRLSARTKHELKAAIGEPQAGTSFQLKFEKNEVYYPMQSKMQRKQSQMSIQFSSSGQSQDYQEQEQIIEQIGEVAVFKVKVQKMFAEDLGDTLTLLLQEPCLALYKQFFKRLMEEIKTFKVNGEQNSIDNFISQSAKLTYLLFQRQFQEHRQIIGKQDNVIVFILSTISAQWRTNSLVGQCGKKLLKRIAEVFPTSEPGIWRNFLFYFRRGLHPQVKEVKEWLISREKCQYVMALLRQLGPLTKQLLESSQQLKLPLYEQN